MSSSRSAQAHKRTSALAAWVLLLASCALEEVTIPLGDEVLVVQGVMTLDPGVPAQYIVVERSLTGTLDVPDQDSLRAPPRPPLPVVGASVVVRRDDGVAMVFTEGTTPGVYELDSATAAGFFQANRVYTLRVDTPAGRVVTGRMRMPDFPVVGGIPPDGAEFNRDHDTLQVTWSGGGATKGVFVQVRPRDIGRRLTMFFFTDSTTFRVGGTQRLPFVSDEHPPIVFVPGTRQTFTVAGIDTNLFDFTRSGNEPFTGSGFLNTLEGALGVFGGVAPVNRTYRIIADADDPIEGRYRLDGILGTGEFDVFVTRDSIGEAPLLLAAIATQTGGALVPQAELTGRLVRGRLEMAILRDVPGYEVQQTRWLLRGVFVPDSTVGDVRNTNGEILGDFSFTRLP